MAYRLTVLERNTRRQAKNNATNAVRALLFRHAFLLPGMSPMV